MKKSLACLLTVSSFSAMANFNEVECRGKLGNKEIYLEIEMPFPSSSSFKRTLLTVVENGAESYYNDTISFTRRSPTNRIQYSGGGTRLDVDLWPDMNPRWARDYRSTLYSSVLGGRQVSNMVCQFPNSF